MFAHLDRLGQDLYEGAAGIAERAASLVVSEVAIPVYVVHRGPDAEAYELFCDFSAFFTGDAVGLLRRPRLEVCAGRADLDRTRFARTLRDAFLAQFDEAKRIFRASHRTEVAAMERNLSGTSWSLGALLGAGGLMFLVTNPVVNLILLGTALTAGRRSVAGLVTLAGQVIHRAALGDPASRLEGEVKDLQSAIDSALARIEIRLHRELYAHAHRGIAPTSMTGMDRAAWPLPDTIRRELR